jgi:hypothetical protein
MPTQRGSIARIRCGPRAGQPERRGRGGRGSRGHRERERPGRRCTRRTRRSRSARRRGCARTTPTPGSRSCRCRWGSRSAGGVGSQTACSTAVRACGRIRVGAGTGRRVATHVVVGARLAEAEGLANELRVVGGLSGSVGQDDRRSRHPSRSFYGGQRTMSVCADAKAGETDHDDARDKDTRPRSNTLLPSCT